jgi:predicted RNA binding protein YcfA (HicA-like mRNA interferase family)
MTRLTSIHWKKLYSVFEKAGFQKDREKGDHIAMTRSDVLRPVIIPKYASIDIKIIRSNMQTANMTREDFFRHLSHT